MTARLALAPPVAALAVAVAIGAWSLAAGASGPPDDAVSPAAAAEIYLAQCATCHGVDGAGVAGRGPDVRDEGRAAVDFVLRTGRMPVAEVDIQPRRGPVRYSDAEIRALVDHVGAFGDGPDIPDVDIGRGSVARGAELYQLNCAACHVASGAGAVIGHGGVAPSLMESTPTQVGQAIIVGPGAMPVFGEFTAADIDDTAAYVAELQRERTTGAEALGGVGPVAEGLAAWLLGLIPLIALTRWIGSPHGDDEAAEAGEGEPAEAGA